jgi:hypothetical protein
MKAVGEMTSRLGTEPYREDPGLEPKLDARDLALGRSATTLRSWAPPKKDVMYL